MQLNNLDFDIYAQKDFIVDLEYKYSILLMEDVFKMNTIKTVKDLINLVKKYGIDEIKNNGK